METHTQRPTRYAILIGIDAYQKSGPGAPNFDLSGCVNDALAIESFLLDNDALPPQNITKLLSPRKARGDKTLLPTHDNIITALEHIRDLDKSKKVDLLYIHYSGHGIRLKSRPSCSIEKDGKMWMALSTYDAFAGGKYLTGRRLGGLIKEIIKAKGARVCLVLDSCFSGGGFRNTEDAAGRASTFQTRFVDESSLGATLLGDTEIATSGSRNSKVTAPWMINPAGCSVLAACGMNQEAGEATFGMETRGVLTHWMLKVLEEHKMDGHRLTLMPSYARLVHEVVRKIQTVGSGAGKGSGVKERHGQTPVARGEIDFRFFGNDITFEKPSCGVIQVRGRDVTIDVGSAQGVSKGAIYTIHPSDASEQGQHGANFSPMQIRVDHVEEFQSTGKLVDSSPESRATNIVAGEFVGVLDTWAYPQAVTVYLQDDLDIESFKAAIQKQPSLNWVVRLQGDLDVESFKAQAAIQEHPSRNWATELLVCINREDKSEILERGIGRLGRVPEISKDDPDAAQKLATIIRHIARYRAIERLLLCRPRLSLNRDSFRWRCLVKDSEDDLDISSDEYIGTEGTSFHFELTYFPPSDGSVWMAVFELNAAWGIRKVYPGYGQNADEVTAIDNSDPDVERDDGTHQPQFSLKLDMNTHIPQKCASKDSQDIVDQYMVFVCAVDDKSPPSWDEISLPSLPVDSEMLRTRDFGAYRYDPEIDNLESNEVVPGKRPSVVKKVPKRTSNRRWNILGFQVRTFPATV